MLCDGTHPLFDTTPEGRLTDLGDLPLPNTSLEGMRAAMAPQLPALLKQHHMVWLGGDLQYAGCGNCFNSSGSPGQSLWPSQIASHRGSTGDYRRATDYFGRLH
jgi:hypothetical protein